MNNVDKLQNVKIGDTYRVFCKESCNDQSYVIYGFKIYDSDSSICKSGYQMDQIQEHGGVFEIKIVKGLEVYQQGEQNGVMSQFKKGSDGLAFTV